MGILVLCAAVRAADRPAKQPDSVFAAAAAAVANGQVEKSRMLGFSIVKSAFEHLPLQGAVLIGFELVLGKPHKDVEVIYSLRPIYQTATGEIIPSESFGRSAAKARPAPSKHSSRDQATRRVRVQALPGFAVGALTLRSDVHVRALSMTFMRLNGPTLDPKQAYLSDWVGDRKSGREASVSGGGAPVVGVFGNQDEQRILALGLIYAKSPTPPAKLREAPPQAEQPVQPPAEKPPAPAAAAPRVEKPVALPPPEQPVQQLPVFPVPDAETYHDPKWHYSFALPDGWKQMAEGEFDKLQAFVRQRRLDQKVRYATGFRPKNSLPGSYPYVLVQVQSATINSYEEIERGLAMDLKGPLQEVQGALGSLAKDISAGGAALDRARNRVVLRMNMDVIRFGKVEAISVCHIGSEAVVSVHCYALGRDFERYLPLFIQFNDTFDFDKGYAFQPGGLGLEAIGKTLMNWLPLVVFAGVAVPLGLVFLMVFSLKGHSTGHRPAQGDLALTGSTTPALAPSPTRREPERAVGGAQLQDAFTARNAGVLARPSPEAAVATTSPRNLEPLPFFTIQAQFTFKKNRLYRVYLRPQELLFLEAGPGCGNEQAVRGAGFVLGGLVGGLIGGILAENIREKAKARQWELDVAEEADLLRMADQGDLNFRATASDLSDIRIEAPSFWDKLDAKVCGRLCLRHRDRGAHAFQFLSIEDMQKAIELLPQVLGEQLAVHAVLDRRNGRYVREA
ncbi:MAG: hypothetical protein L0Z62_43130 [Gemmataceae bacterium]|nr:hypothetical protein [Gemmataceae bacterium]